ncbi:ArsR/SmtB family transcription factor [Engelhardtia mirabilis]|uniref:Helix-turn-helix domain protein n=1 Tax=Engelhardtia mirabilis TaxID=2528011 RepID=A0A518BE02_9BACT|nr:Helix-turn-helix domain protein [Planctomycetes bacterium Pla133]QDU99543.1 Helix-turn-helix domain protein [Planctomycetes bacterium Pla86]
MLAMLAQGQRTVGELAEPFDVSLAASSKHLQVLERAGLVEREVVGRRHTCHLRPARLAAVVDWTERCRATWDANFARLDAVLGELKAGTKSSARRPKGRKR